MEEQLAKWNSGFFGERSLKYFYRYLPKKDIIFVYNVRIFHIGYHFQIDTLIITSKFFMILEIKNYAGHLYFDDKFGQLVRTLNGKKDIFEDPILQVKRQLFHLTHILNKYKLPIIPIEPLVVISNPKSFVESSPTYKEALKIVIKSPKLQNKYEEFNNNYKENILTFKEMKKISKILYKLDEPYNPDIYKHFGIQHNELIRGVLCSKCDSTNIMNRVATSWKCTSCFSISKTAQIQALKDYALLISTQISNQECKNFLNLSTRDQSHYLLNSLKLTYTGTTRSRTYHLDSLLNS
ncbi:nuclease-related domain-containing protein [Fictibacillus barbaricus]|uniref:Ribosomal protein L37AE/L43A n=1 Tax=Fictibacillus barbaricus TaxID=182136 RepID=A0ABU1TWV9_9BACL|nr:nuclease-related domain-containing protein [Fictibacillus barbaricus]MDR7071717.1 ribosomal protein L37AE/L43A [Fictibacillus barbaricus]